MTRCLHSFPGAALCLTLAACAPSERLPAPAPPSVTAEPVALPPPPPPPPPVESLANIAGAWDIVSFEGYRPRRLSGSSRAAFADFGPNGVGLRIECNWSGRAGAVSGGRFVRAKENDGAQTVMSCGPERNGRESRYFRFFEQNPTIERLGAERLRLTSGATELILERPALRRLQFVPSQAELEGEWRLLGLTRYDGQGGTSGIGLSETPGRIVIAGDSLAYSRCPQYGLTFRWEEGGRLVKSSGASLPADLRDCRELREPYPLPAMPAPADLLRLLHSSPQVEWTGDGILLISTERLGLLITKTPCESTEQSNDHRTTRTVDCTPPR